jgi:acyl-CoA reductase-like NAD-dependent aldehyde dehydrogenase
VAPLYRKTEADAVKMANDAPTLTLPRARGREERGRIWRVAEALEYGIVGINGHHLAQKPAGEIAPFGGMKECGIGPIWGHWGSK